MIPPHARKVFSGELFEIHQWEQELFDGSTAIFERARRTQDTVQVIAVTDEGSLVLLREEQPDTVRHTSLPGGRIDPGEEPLAAAARELAEETGLVSDGLATWKTYTGFPKLEWNVHYIIARDCSERASTSLDPGERITVRTVSFDEWLEAMTAPGALAGNFTADMLRLKLDPEALAAFKARLGLD